MPAEAPPATIDDVAGWMLAELSRRHGILDEPTTALEIVRLFGGDFCDVTPEGTFTISRPVVDAFSRLSLHGDDEVIWDGAERAWRLSGRRPSPYR
jgi:hypothetical protein